MLMRGTPPTMRFPPHQSRPTENPPNLQPTTAGEEERDVEADVDEGGLRLQAATDSAACVAAPQQHQPTPPAKGRSPQLRPCTGKEASAGAGPLRRATRPAAGHACAPPPSPPTPPPQPHTTRPLPTTTRPEEMRTSCRQQPAPPPRDAAKLPEAVSPERGVYLTTFSHLLIVNKLLSLSLSLARSRTTFIIETCCSL